MNPELGMILCLFGFGICAAMVWWSAVRVPLFQADIQLMIDELDAAMMADGTIENHGYLQFRSQLRQIIIYSPYISIVQYFLMKWPIRGTPAVPSEHSDFVAGLQEFADFGEDLKIVKQFKVRLMIHLLRFLASSPADGLIFFLLVMLGRTKTLASALASLQLRDGGRLSPQAH